MVERNTQYSGIILTHSISIYPRYAYLVVCSMSNGALSSRIISVFSELTNDSFTSASRTSEDRANSRTTLKLPKVSLMFHIMYAEVLYAHSSFLFQYYTHTQNRSSQMTNTLSLRVDTLDIYTILFTNILHLILHTLYTRKLNVLQSSKHMFKKQLTL